MTSMQWKVPTVYVFVVKECTSRTCVLFSTDPILESQVLDEENGTVVHVYTTS